MDTMLSEPFITFYVPFLSILFTDASIYTISGNPINCVMFLSSQRHHTPVLKPNTLH